MGWLFNSSWSSREDVMNACSILSSSAIEKGWTIPYKKLCRGGFALAYKNTKTGEVDLSYHLAERHQGEWGEKCVDPFIAFEIMPKSIVDEFMQQRGDHVYCGGKTYRDYYNEMLHDKAVKLERSKIVLEPDKWYCINTTGYSSMPLGVGRFGGARGRSLIFGGYRMVGLSKSDVISEGFDTREEAETWAVYSHYAKLKNSYFFDKVKEHLTNKVAGSNGIELDHYTNLLGALERGAA